MTTQPDAYVQAIECPTCYQFFSIDLGKMVTPIACPHCGAHYLPLSPDVVIECPAANEREFHDKVA